VETIGTLLKNLRQKQNLSLEQVSAETKIAPHLLKFLEADDFSNLPSSTYTKGFITKYAEVVGLSPQKALAIFRRDFAITESGKIMPKGLAKPLDKPTMVTSKILTISGIMVLVVLFAGYLIYQLKTYHSAPKIEIVRPKPNSMVQGPIIPVKGYVSADSSVYVNDSIIEVFPTGVFQATAQLPPGTHTITVKAVNNQNKVSEQLIPVTVVDK
jgi:cytoskeletal protein RodZ